MNRLTYAQVRSAACSLIREKLFNGQRFDNYILIYKDAGGDFNKRELRKGITICYTGIKSIVYVDNKGNIITEVSRETISEILEAVGVNMVYLKMA